MQPGSVKALLLGPRRSGHKVSFLLGGRAAGPLPHIKFGLTSGCRPYAGSPSRPVIRHPCYSGAMVYENTCIVGHRSVFWLFGALRTRRWWVRHQHPEAV